VEKPFTKKKKRAGVVAQKVTPEFKRQYHKKKKKKKKDRESAREIPRAGMSGHDRYHPRGCVVLVSVSCTLEGGAADPAWAGRATRTHKYIRLPCWVRYQAGTNVTVRDERCWLLQKSGQSQAPMAHAYNPSYLGD
jgi:hypothetical protein